MRKLLAFFLSAIILGIRAEQVVLDSNREQSNGYDVELKRDAPFIFNNVNSLLRQWGNTLAPNGFSFVVASIPAGTTLYHARKDAHDPPSPEWLAFDSEMSYAIMGGRGETFLRTYRSARTLGPLLYINGMSAALTTTGSLDSQDLLVGAGRGIFDEYGRAARLCEWGASFGVEGFVRQNAGFELLWCDWSAGIELVHNNNVTHWLADLNATVLDGRGSRRSHSDDNLGLEKAKISMGIDLLASRSNESVVLPEEPYPPRRPGSSPTRPPYGRYGWNVSPFASYSFWEWLRSATLVYGGVGEMRVQLAYGSFVTCYGRAGLSLPSRNPRTHRLTNVTLAEDTAQAIRDDIAASVALFNTGSRSTADWRGITDQVVNRYGRRLPELHALLLNGTADALRQSKYLIASLLIPSYDPAESRPQNRAACASAFLPPEETLSTSAERVILDAVTIVQQDVCEVLLVLHDDLFNAHTSFVPQDHAALLYRLMDRLGWYLWTKCDSECAWGQVCYIPIWPVLMGRPGRRDPGAPSEPTKPVCLGYGESP